MSGNALEEGLLGNLNSPTHLDPARIAVPLAAICAILIYLGLGSFLPGLHPILKLLLSFAIFFAVFLSVWRRLLRRQLLRTAAEMEAQRQAMNAETERQVAEMRKKETDA